MSSWQLVKKLPKIHRSNKNLFMCCRCFCNIKACNVLKLDSAVSTLLNRYSDELFEKVIKAKDYPFSVITMLEKKLNEKGISNRCRDIYCKIHNCAISVL